MIHLTIISALAISGCNQATSPKGPALGYLDWHGYFRIIKSSYTSKDVVELSNSIASKKPVDPKFAEKVYKDDKQSILALKLMIDNGFLRKSTLGPVQELTRRIDALDQTPTRSDELDLLFQWSASAFELSKLPSNNQNINTSWLRKNDFGATRIFRSFKSSNPDVRIIALSYWTYAGEIQIGRICSEKWISESPNDGRLYTYAALFYYFGAGRQWPDGKSERIARQPDKAIHYARKATLLMPDNAGAHYTLGRVSMHSDNKTAKRAFERYLVLEDHSSERKDAAKRALAALSSPTKNSF